MKKFFMSLFFLLGGGITFAFLNFYLDLNGLWNDGQILKILIREGEKLEYKPMPILKMGNTKQMYAVAEVYETDIRFIKQGQKALIESPALPEVLQGAVRYIGIGDYFGEIALMKNVPRTATIRAITPCICLSCSSRPFKN